MRAGAGLGRPVALAESGAMRLRIRRPEAPALRLAAAAGAAGLGGPLRAPW